MEALINALAKFFESVRIHSLRHPDHLCLKPTDFQAAMQVLIYAISQYRLAVTPEMNLPLDGVVTELKQLSKDADAYLEYPYDEDLLEELAQILSPCESSFHTGQYDMIAALFSAKIFVRTLPKLDKDRKEDFSSSMNKIMWDFFDHDDQLTLTMLANNRRQGSAITQFVKTHRLFLTALLSKNADDWWAQLPETLKDEMKECSKAFRNFGEVVNGNQYLKKRTALFFNNTAIYDKPIPTMMLSSFESALCESLIGVGRNFKHSHFLNYAPEEFAALKILCYRFPMVAYLFKTNLATLNLAAQDWENFENAKNCKKRLHQSDNDDDSDDTNHLVKRTIF